MTAWVAVAAAVFWLWRFRCNVRSEFGFTTLESAAHASVETAAAAWFTFVVVVFVVVARAVV